MLYELKMSSNTMQATKKHLLYKKWNHSWSLYINQIVQEILLKLQELQWSGDSEAVFQAIVANLASSNLTVQRALSLSWLLQKHHGLPNFASHYQNIQELLTCSS